MLVSDDQLKALLVSSALVDEKQLEALSHYAASTGIALSDGLIEKEIISDENLGLLVANLLQSQQANLHRLLQ